MQWILKKNNGKQYWYNLLQRSWSRQRSFDLAFPALWDKVAVPEVARMTLNNSCSFSYIDSSPSDAGVSCSVMSGFGSITTTRLRVGESASEWLTFGSQSNLELVLVIALPCTVYPFRPANQCKYPVSALGYQLGHPKEKILHCRYLSNHIIRNIRVAKGVDCL